MIQYFWYLIRTHGPLALGAEILVDGCIVVSQCLDSFISDGEDDGRYASEVLGTTRNHRCTCSEEPKFQNIRSYSFFNYAETVSSLLFSLKKIRRPIAFVLVEAIFDQGSFLLPSACVRKNKILR